MALSPAARRAIAIRNSIARKAKAAAAPTAANDNAERRATRRPRRTQPSGLLQACIDAAGFDQNARFA